MPGYLFARDVQQAVSEGRREILVPAGTRISPAALDLIRDYGLKIVQPDRTGAAPVEPRVATGTDGASPVEGSTSVPEYTEEEVEAIVRRVLARLAEAKKERTREGPAPEADDDLVICRCEEITKGEIKAAVRSGLRTLNGVKRVTRAGMGLCQGQTCQRLVTQILAGELGLPPDGIEPATARAPVRPVRLSVFATG
ncbi:MAG: (2Fe-2S)-binding protein [Thermodesulfobacteriota bacterium]